MSGAAQNELSAAQALLDGDRKKAAGAFKALVGKGDALAKAGKSVPRAYEKAVYELGSLYAEEGDSHAIAALLESLKVWFARIPKVRTAKIVKYLIRKLDSVEGAKRLELKVVQDIIGWCEANGQHNLRQSLETQLAALYFENEKYNMALDLLTRILSEVKRMDDKQLQVEIQLLESSVQHALRNIPKARASLTAARTAANSIYCPPAIQSKIDMQAGILHAEEKDYKTAYSYFYESFEGYHLQDDEANAVRALKYMLLSKIMANKSEDLSQILTNKLALKYAGSDVEAMKSVGQAYKERSLKVFKSVQEKFEKEIVEDPIVNVHLTELYDALLEQNLLRIIEPYSCVEISRVAQLIDLTHETVEKKLSQMILDKRFDGVIDAANDCLYVYEESEAHTTYDNALSAMQHMNKVVSSLFESAARLN